MIHFYAGSQDHHVNHLAPIFLALPEPIRGQFICRGRAASRAASLNIPHTRTRTFRRGETVVVCSYADYRFTSQAKVIYLCHGVGQIYPGDPRTASLDSLTGGKKRDRVILFLCPSQRVADLWGRYYPNVPTIPVGPCYLDQFIPHSVPPNGPIAISFHVDLKLIPEMRWAWGYYKGAIETIARSGDLDILGHAHPRARRELEPWWKKLGVRYEADWWKVLRECSVYVVDNSSTLWEAAALGIPTVTLNTPTYRRDVHHGLRFWDAIPGEEVNEPLSLIPAIQSALHTSQPNRESAIEKVFGRLADGHATKRAVEAILHASNVA